jgi:hypothetical protein
MHTITHTLTVKCTVVEVRGTFVPTVNAQDCMTKKETVYLYAVYIVMSRHGWEDFRFLLIHFTISYEMHVMLFNILHFLLLTLVEKYLYYGEKIWHF